MLLFTTGYLWLYWILNLTHLLFKYSKFFRDFNFKSEYLNIYVARVRNQTAHKASVIINIGMMAGLGFHSNNARI